MSVEQDASLYAMTRAPLASSPTMMAQSDTLTNLKSELRSALSGETILDPTPDTSGLSTTEHQDGPDPETEAFDYMNGGLPHERLKVAFANGSSTPPQSPKAPPRVALSSTPPTGAVADDDVTSTPTGRRSVQFARTDIGTEHTGQSRKDSTGMEEEENHGRERKSQSLMSKLRALAMTGALTTHSRSQSEPNVRLEDRSVSEPVSPTAEEHLWRSPLSQNDDSGDADADADAEETADENMAPGSAMARRKRRNRRLQRFGPQTAPSTPNARTATLNISDSPNDIRPNGFLRRRNTLPDDVEDRRGGLSEGEGRDRLTMSNAWKRGSSWIGGIRGQSYTTSTPPDADATPSSRRQINFRRATGLGAGSDGDAQTPRRPFLSSERATTFGANRWKLIKHGFKMLGQKKEEHKIDYMKSAELMAELRAGAPAVLMLASMIQRDEHGNKRIPVLLEQLKLQITDSQGSDEAKESERHLVFRIELEYGSGLNRMKWTISRSLRDFLNLHLRYKLQANSDKYIQLRDINSRPKQPHFPKSAFPWLRGARGIGESEDDEADVARVDDTVGEATHSETDRPERKKKSRPGFTPRRKSSGVGDSVSGATSGAGGEPAQALAASHTKRAYNDRQRRKLETYLQSMIRWLIFRPDSNRLCKFLELSALGVRLAAEGGYHGKEGFMAIQTAKGIDFRKMLTPTAIFARHKPKWFLVRHSYIVCVDSPENMHIYDVFLLDSKFEIQNKRRRLIDKSRDSDTRDASGAEKEAASWSQHHRLKLQNSERKIRLLAKNERQLRQFEESIRLMMTSSCWAKPNRFQSFAPVRTGVFAQWLVDGRDYMWNVSRAINQAKDVIYIHDWWLSPQLYMRRPAAISQKWRLDRLLRKKAREGVKVFIIIYRNVEAAVPIDSEFTKFSMLDLHPNVFVQRSPNQFKKNQFFFAHHEKICVVDHSVAFVGGIDLCFGRWDTPQHSVCDDKPTGFEQSDEPKDSDHCQLWPGKDYSNPRVQDFFQLNEPYAEMYDRSKTPRMPWHDISMQIVGQPARDLTRHFVQRWNFILRGRKPTRPTPFLLPPPDYLPADIETQGLTGTCEVQILRSAAYWSMGLEETEYSIMTAYCKMIEESEHFVYIENQFFITSTETMNTKIMNKIGDAIVERAIRAHRNNENWRCIILIPLMPGFQNTVDAPDGTSVRLIMQCQFRSINRGEDSLFGRLRAESIEPEDYVNFYSLRAWGKIGPRKNLVTEQLYIHAKAIIVDDRIALIGSANINERSMLGNRDSETAAVVRDTDMIWSTMGGEPYLVGRFAHSLRMRLMREHLGLDVDEVMDEERRAEVDREEQEFHTNMDRYYDDEDDSGAESPSKAAEDNRIKKQKEEQRQSLRAQSRVRSFNHDVDWEQASNPNLLSTRIDGRVTSDKRVTNDKSHAAEVDGEGPDHWKAAEKSGAVRGRDSVLVDGVREVLVANIAPEGKGTIEEPKKPHMRRLSQPRPHESNPGTGNTALPPNPPLLRKTTDQLGLVQLSQLPALPVLDDTDIGGPPVHKDGSGKPIDAYNPLTADIKRATVDKDCMKDPLNDTFFEDVWQLIADNNTKIFRRVFRCNPDNEVTNWHEYKEVEAYGERFSQAQNGGKSLTREEQEGKGKSGPPGAASAIPQLGPVGEVLTKTAEKASASKNNDSGRHPIGTVADWAKEAEAKNRLRSNTLGASGGVIDEKTGVIDEKAALKSDTIEAISPILPSGDIPFPVLDPKVTVPTNTDSEKGVIETDLPSVIPINSETEKITEGTPTLRTSFMPSQEKSTSGVAPGITSQDSTRRRRRTTNRSKRGFLASDDLISRRDAEALLDLVQGSLVVFPYDWLKAEEHNSNWLYQVDMVAPLQIYD